MIDPQELAESITTRLAARKAAAAERKAERKRERAELNRRRTAGLRARHNRKINRKERNMPDTITTLPTATKLYRLTSVIDSWPHRGGLYNGVKVDWWVESRSYDPGFDYRALLGRRLPAGDGYSFEQGIVDELFTPDEADQLAAYLRTPPNVVDVTMTELSAPIPTRMDGLDIIPTSAIAVGGCDDMYMLYKHEDYDLPFEVSGYYSVWDMHPSKVRACGHECEHHQGIDAYVDYTPPSMPRPTAIINGISGDLPF